MHPSRIGAAEMVVHLHGPQHETEAEQGEQSLPFEEEETVVKAFGSHDGRG
jgi:hypothetical protein